MSFSCRIQWIASSAIAVVSSSRMTDIRIDRRSIAVTSHCHCRKMLDLNAVENIGNSSGRWLSNPIFESFEDIVGHCYFA